jgi:hypothetical protein
VNFQPGDKAVLFGRTMLSNIGLSGYAGKTVTLTRKLSQSEIETKSCLRGGTEAWWVTIGANTSPYYVPLCCLALTDDAEFRFGSEQPKTETKKEENMLIAVTILKTPSVKAQEAGETEQIVVSTKEVVAHDNNAAIALVSAEHAIDIVGLKEEGSKLRVLVRQIG